MAMLQFGGVLSNATVRTTPRTWWTAAQHLLHASSVATNLVSPVAPADSPKNKRIENYKKKDHENSIIRTVFQRLLTEAQQDLQQKQNDSETINSNQMVDELLNIVNSKYVSEVNVADIMFILSKWISSGKIKMSDIQSDSRYIKLKKLSEQTSFSIAKQLDHLTDFQSIIQTEKAKYQINKLQTHEVISVLKMLAVKKKRSRPLLQVLVENLSTKTETLNIRELGDIFYSLAMLNFYDEALIQKAVKDLKELIDTNESSPIIGSILTSLSLLRFKDEKLLDELSSWIFKHREKIRSQEITSLLLTLANLGYTPKNFSEVLEHIIKNLNESDMCHSKDWLDVIWSLCVLNCATADQYKSVLNSNFVNRVVDAPDLRIHTSKILKLLNINGAAQSFMPEYKGPFIPEDSEIMKVPIIRSDKMGLSNSITSALKVLLPADSSYLNINANTQMGFLLDAEFCVDTKGTPVVVNFQSNDDRQFFRIGILTCSYNDYCRGVNEVLGPIKLYTRLLEHQGYKVLLIPFTDVDQRDKIVTRVKYINDKIKILLKNDETK